MNYKFVDVIRHVIPKAFNEATKVIKWAGWDKNIFGRLLCLFLLKMVIINRLCVLLLKG
jgi:hypothetical protein